MDAKCNPGEETPSIKKFTVPQESETSTQSTYAKHDDKPIKIESVRPIDPVSFPNVDRNGHILGTIANVKHLLENYEITARYNVISKKLLVNIPGHSGGSDNFDNVAMSHIVSLAALNGIPMGQLASYVAVIGDENQFNPVATWITSKPWDGVDRFQALSNTLKHREGYPVELKNIMLRKWLISAVAAIFKPGGFKARGVLVLQGPQSIGKTSWISELVPDPFLRDGVMKLDHHLDPGNKDSVITAVSAWIVEIGELDSSFKKDIARLKGFLTSDSDKLRRPYARANSEYPRRTVFTATVNESTFLVDTTGNSRFWTIPITTVNYTHGIDMQQLWAQMTTEFHDGQQWWLTKAEEELLGDQNREHQTISVIRERVLEAIDLERVGTPDLTAMSASQLLIEIGFSSPTNSQSKECASVLREYLGESKKINGIYKWRIPLARTEYFPSRDGTYSKSSKIKSVDDDDKY